MKAIRSCGFEGDQYEGGDITRFRAQESVKKTWLAVEINLTTSLSCSSSISCSCSSSSYARWYSYYSSSSSNNDDFRDTWKLWGFKNPDLTGRVRSSVCAGAVLGIVKF